MNAQSLLPQWTQDMEMQFIKRNEHHRFLVRNNILRMEGYLSLTLTILREAADSHDISKYQEPERSAYIWMTWMYHCKNNDIPFSYPDSVASLVAHGWKTHISNNSHHPEAHPTADAMSDLDIVEMVCDWTAIHQELNQGIGSCLTWAKNTLSCKWNFSAVKKDLIYTTINELDRRNSINIAKAEV